MQREVTLAGFGGQGIMMIGQIVAYAGMDEALDVTWLPSYGPEMRGGTAYCTVIVSDRPISSPVISDPEICVAMNRPSLEKFGPTVRSGGFVLINSSLIHVGSGRKDVDELLVPCNEMAAEAGNPRCANIVMLGALIGRTNLVSREPVLSRIKYSFAKKGDDALRINIRAFGMGEELAKRTPCKLRSKK